MEEILINVLCHQKEVCSLPVKHLNTKCTVICVIRDVYLPAEQRIALAFQVLILAHTTATYDLWRPFHTKELIYNVHFETVGRCSPLSPVLEAV